MKKVITLVLVAVVCQVQNLQAQVTASFNFSSGSQTVSGWNNVAGDPAVAVRTATDASTGISVSSIATTNWYGYNGSSAFDGGGQTGGTFFPAAVMLNHWFQYGTYYGAYNGALPQLQLSGLNPDSVYTLKMTGSFINQVPGTFTLNPIRYTVAGATLYGYVDVNGNFNTTDGAVFNNVAPDDSGRVRIYVNTYNGSNVASICGLQVIQGHTSAPVPVVSITNPGNNAVLAEDYNVNITASATETGGSIARVQFFVNDVKIGEDSSAPYGCTWVNPDAGTYTIKVRAYDGVGNSTTVTSSVTIDPLSSFWSMTGNIAANADSNFLGTVDTNRLAFRTNNIERMSILKDGTVGIGTKNTSGYLLAVNGSAIFTKVKVKTAGTWPDYVFEKGYELPDLNELEQYLAAHKHLPGIVPAAEAQKEGIDVADQQAALLKKVEELTLYLIGENKQLKEQVRKDKEQNTKLEQQQQQIDQQAKQLQLLQEQLDALTKMMRSK